MLDKQFKIHHFVHDRSTKECNVTFRLCRAKMKIVKDYFAKTIGKNGLELHFKSCKVFWRGCGWYKVVSCNDKVDGALDAIKHVVNALKIHAGLLISKITKQELPAVSLPSRYKIVARIGKFKQIRLVNLAVEAAHNCYVENMTQFKTWLVSKDSKENNPGKIANDKFSKVKLAKMVQHLSQFHHA